MTRACPSLLVSTLSLLFLLVPETTWAQSHFTDCTPSDVNDATVLVPDTVTVTVGDVDSLQTGDEIALFSDDGKCAGAGVWDASDEALSITVAGVDNTADVTDAYELEEPLQFRIWRQSDETVYDVSDVNYNCTLASCRSDGKYDPDAVYEVAEVKGTSLPVELTTFEATRQDGTVLLQWRTASETNNAGFEVQRRATTDDAWARLSFVDGAGTTTTPQTYQHEVDDLDVGEYEFRLKQVNDDGSSTLSESVQVRLELDGAFELSELSPNPVQNVGAFELTVKKTQQVTVEVFDVLGRKAETPIDRRMDANQTERFRLEAHQLSSGKYFLRIRGEHFQTTREMIVVK